MKKLSRLFILVILAISLLTIFEIISVEMFSYIASGCLLMNIGYVVLNRKNI